MGSRSPQLTAVDSVMIPVVGLTVAWAGLLLILAAVWGFARFLRWGVRDDRR